MRPDKLPSIKSEEYRKWIRDNLSCCNCSSPLILEKETFLTHHHWNSGGKFPSDHCLVPLCLKCHNWHHQGIKLDVDWEKEIITCLSAYLENAGTNTKHLIITTLAEVLRGKS